MRLLPVDILVFNTQVKHYPKMGILLKLTDETKTVGVIERPVMIHYKGVVGRLCGVKFDVIILGILRLQFTHERLNGVFSFGGGGEK